MLEVITLAGGDGGRETKDGNRTSARLSGPTGITMDRNGDLYILEETGSCIRKLDPAGNVTTLCGNMRGFQDGTFKKAQFQSPFGITCDDKRDFIYVTDFLNRIIRKVDLKKEEVTTYAGKLGQSTNKDGPGKEACFHSPSGMAVDEKGILIVSDTAGGHLFVLTAPGYIRKIDMDQVVTTLVAKPEIGNVYDVAVMPDGSYVFPDTQHHNVKRYFQGEVSVIAGTLVTHLTVGLPHGSLGFRDGEASTAQFNQPSGIAVDLEGTILICDTYNHCIRELRGGQVRVIAGVPTSSGYQDGAESRFSSPYGICVDATGIYIADFGNNRVRKILRPIQWTTSRHKNFDRSFKDLVKTVMKLSLRSGQCQFSRVPKDVIFIIIRFICQRR